MAANNSKFLIFTMHAKLYAFDLAHVAEVMDPVMSWPIPLAPACYTGAINFHGAIVPVMDLAVFLGFGISPELGKLIVLDVKGASLGFLVERVTRIVPKQETELNEGSDVYCASASLCLPEGNAVLLDIDSIVRAAEIAINGKMFQYCPAAI